MAPASVTSAYRISRIPHGMRGLKSARLVRYCVNLGRIPHGMRGLKYGAFRLAPKCIKVASRMGCVD